jgi:ribosomal-protein-alanine N-acetyltransferase
VTSAEPPSTASWRIEPLDPGRDLDSVVALDAESFSAPWTRAMYEEFLANSDVSHIWVVRGMGGQVVAYCSFLTVLDEVHINNLAVRAEQRRRGLASALVRRILRDGVAGGVGLAVLEVRRSNAAARRLYAELGFQERGVRRNYYAAPTEDALLLSWRPPS